MFNPDLEQVKSDYGTPLPRVHRAPLQTPKFRIEMERAAAAHVEANRSNPFARGRILLHMRRGLDLPSDVSKAANRLLVGVRRIPN